MISLTTVKISKNYLCSGMSNMSCRNLIICNHFPFKRSTPKGMAFSTFKKKTEKSPIVNTSNKLVILQVGTLVVRTGPLQMGSIGTPGLAITIGKTI